jgi:anti-sigma factor (TIGR02949 family)
LLTCKEFLQELTDYLDSTVDAELRVKLERHINECPNCFVILDTTQKTIKVYKGLQAQEIPEEVRVRLMRAVERKMATCKRAPAEPDTTAGKPGVIAGKPGV